MTSPPTGVLLCDPQYFDIVDVKNPFMAGSGSVDTTRARQQWNAMADAFRRTGAEVLVMPPVAGCEDMVFCANTALTGLDRDGARCAVVSHMLHPSRQREIEPSISTFEQLGYNIRQMPGPARFEGGGDAVWHVGRNRLFAGSGPRSEPAAYEFVKEVFGCEVVPMTLLSPQFYHLDTCFCVIDEETALIHPPALTKDGYDAACRFFSNVIEVDADEAMRFACNACSIADTVLIEQSAIRTIEQLRQHGFDVLPVDTSEFMKSGGSVYCMKQYLF